MYLAVQELAQRTTMVRALASVANSRSPARDAALQGGAWLVIKRPRPRTGRRAAVGRVIR
jgi:hypothetical protein